MTEQELMERFAHEMALKDAEIGSLRERTHDRLTEVLASMRKDGQGLSLDQETTIRRALEKLP